MPHTLPFPLVFLNLNTDPRDHSSCALSYDEQAGWIVATWSGFVNPVEATQGAQAYLEHAAQVPCALLLNDNSRLIGPWFDSLDWLAQVWVPQASRLGLRRVAHIMQTDRHHDALSALPAGELPFELQIFHEGADARHWLHQFQAGHGHAALPGG